jgi:hypothetical protein
MTSPVDQSLTQVGSFDKYFTKHPQEISISEKIVLINGQIVEMKKKFKTTSSSSSETITHKTKSYPEKTNSKKKSLAKQDNVIEISLLELITTLGLLYLGYRKLFS